MILPHPLTAGQRAVLTACALQSGTVDTVDRAVNAGSLTVSAQPDRFDPNGSSITPVGSTAIIGHCTFRRGVCSVSWQPHAGWWRLHMSWRLGGGGGNGDWDLHVQA